MFVTRALAIWIIGLFTAVPYATYYLFFEAVKDQYTWLITFILFWIFGYWGIVGPIISAIKARAVFRAIEMSHEQGKLKETMQNAETEDVIIELIANENHLPKFIAAKIYRMMLKKMSKQNESLNIMANPGTLDKSGK